MPDLTQRVIDKALADAAKDRRRRELTDGRSVGLVLNVGPRGGVWYWQSVRRDRHIRLRLGGLETWTLAEARMLSAEAHRLVTDLVGVPDENWLAGRRRHFGKDPAAPAAEAMKARLTWTFGQAREAFLAEIKRTRRPASHADYAGKLKTAEIEALAREPVAAITLARMSKAIHAIGGREKYAMAEGATRVVKSMWSWLADPARAEQSGVQPDVMRRLRPPERPLAETDDGLYVPTPEEVGRIVAIARSGALDPSLALAVQLLVYTAQRRLTIVTAERAHFKERDGRGEGLWTIPSRSRKSGRSRPGTHVIPLPPSAWSVVRQADAHGYKRDSAYAFPGRGRGPEGRHHIHADRLTHVFAAMPGVSASPHDIRRAFGTHGEKLLGIPRAMTAHVLDHGGGDDGVTAEHYVLHDRSHLTWPILDKWCGWVDEQAEEAIAADPGLGDTEWLRKEMARADAERRAGKSDHA